MAVQAEPPSPQNQTTPDDPETEVDLAELGVVGRSLGTGGQAEVFELPAPWHQQVFKRYKPGIGVDAASMDQLIEWRVGLPKLARLSLDEHACWPLGRVVEKKATVGVLLNRAPENFSFVNRSNNRRLQELQHLFLVDRARKKGQTVLEPVDRIRVVRQLAELLRFFARHGIVHGDLSMKNLLWAAPGESETSMLFVLDCDGVRMGNRPAPLPDPVATPGWVDPRVERGEIRAHDEQSDLYALALAFYRCYYGQNGDIDGQASSVRCPVWPPTPPEIQSLLGRGLSHRPARPSAEEWIIALDALIAGLRDPANPLGASYRNPPTVEPRAQLQPVANPPGPRLRPQPRITRQSRLSPSILAVVIGLALGVIISLLLIVFVVEGEALGMSTSDQQPADYATFSQSLVLG